MKVSKNPARGFADNNKLVSLSALVSARDALDAEGRTLALVNGCFDILHAGHNFFLHNAANLADVLVVMLNSAESVRSLKGDGRPVFGDDERAYNLAALEAVDYVCIFSTRRLGAQIAAVRPHVYAKSGDYAFETLDIFEREALERCNSRIVFLPFLEGFSTTSIIGRIGVSAAVGERVSE